MTNIHMTEYAVKRASVAKRGLRHVATIQTEVFDASYETLSRWLEHDCENDFAVMMSPDKGQVEFVFESLDDATLFAIAFGGKLSTLPPRQTLGLSD